MGSLVEKYTNGCFLKEDEEGMDVIDGVEGAAGKKGESNIRNIHESILSKVDFSGKNVIELGYGRGEAIKYTLNHGADYVVGVDFSENSYLVARDYLINYNDRLELYCEDTEKQLIKFKNNESFLRDKFDIVIMLDFVEHVPREELRRILELLKFLLNDSSLLIVNTPIYAVDNDVIKEGIKELALDSSDQFIETLGMHCNRYTLGSLESFFNELHFYPITGHYFLFEGKMEDSWKKYFEESKPEKDCEEYEYAHTISDKEILAPKWYTVKYGLLEGRDIYLSRDIEVNEWKDSIINGTHDKFFFDFLNTVDLKDYTFIDVGAHIGFHTLCFATLVGNEGKVYAFEPNRFNRERIEINLFANKDLSQRIQILDYALSNNEGQVEFTFSKNVDLGHSSGSFIHGSYTPYDNDVYKHLHFVTEWVKSVRFDDIYKILKFSDIKKTIIKIDVEGGENMVLEGAKSFIHEYRPILLVELHSIQNIAFTIDFCADVDYKITFLEDISETRSFIVAKPATELTNEKVLRKLLYQKSLDSIKSRDIKIAELGDEKQKLNQANQDLRQTIQVLNQTTQELGQANQEFSKANHELGQANQEFSQANQELSHANQEFSHANQELSHANQELSKVNHELGQANQELSQENQKINSSNQELNQSNQELTQVICDIKLANQEMIEFTHDLQQKYNTLLVHYSNLENSKSVRLACKINKILGRI